MPERCAFDVNVLTWEKGSTRGALARPRCFSDLATLRRHCRRNYHDPHSTLQSNWSLSQPSCKLGQAGISKVSDNTCYRRMSRAFPSLVTTTYGSGRILRRGAEIPHRIYLSSLAFCPRCRFMFLALAVGSTSYSQSPKGFAGGMYRDCNIFFNSYGDLSLLVRPFWLAICTVRKLQCQSR